MTSDRTPLSWPTDDDSIVRLDDEDILALVHSGARRFDRTIRRRDWVELAASVVVALIVAPATLRGPLLARAGALIILGSLVLIAVRLRRARRNAGATDATLPVMAALRAERERVDAQIVLLETVAWWYMAPLAVGSVTMVAGFAGMSSLTVGYAVVMAFVSWGVVALNARSVRRVLRPKRHELTKLLAQLES